MKKHWMMLLMVAVALNVWGCTKKADAAKPMDQVRAEAEKMTAADLEATAKAYASEIAAKKSDVEKIQAKLSGLSLQDMVGEKAKSIKDEASKVGQEISALTERYEVYAQKFQATGGDVSKIKLS